MDNVLEILNLILMFIVGVIGFRLGMMINATNELENGCVVYNDKVYCEVVNEK